MLTDDFIFGETTCPIVCKTCTAIFQSKQTYWDHIPSCMFNETKKKSTLDGKIVVVNFLKYPSYDFSELFVHRSLCSVVCENES